jgi:hypothetical protein
VTGKTGWRSANTQNAGHGGDSQTDETSSDARERSDEVLGLGQTVENAGTGRENIVLGWTIFDCYTDAGGANAISSRVRKQGRVIPASSLWISTPLDQDKGLQESGEAESRGRREVRKGSLNNRRFRRSHFMRGIRDPALRVARNRLVAFSVSG